jgi:hypothetical protein
MVVVPRPTELRPPREYLLASQPPVVKISGRIELLPEMDSQGQAGFQTDDNRRMAQSEVHRIFNRFMATAGDLALSEDDQDRVFGSSRELATCLVQMGELLLLASNAEPKGRACRVRLECGLVQRRVQLETGEIRWSLVAEVQMLDWQINGEQTVRSFSPSPRISPILHFECEPRTRAAPNWVDPRSTESHRKDKPV